MGKYFVMYRLNFFDDHINSLVWWNITGHRYKQHPRGNIFLCILWDYLHIIFQCIWLQNHQQPIKMWPIAICGSKIPSCVFIGGIRLVIGYLQGNHFIFYWPVVGRTSLSLTLHILCIHCVLFPLDHSMLWFLLGVI